MNVFIISSFADMSPEMASSCAALPGKQGEPEPLRAMQPGCRIVRTDIEHALPDCAFPARGTCCFTCATMTLAVPGVCSPANSTARFEQRYAAEQTTDHYWGILLIRIRRKQETDS
ncbi:MAG: hypothetical protein ACNA7E_10785 [Wenzhouxiangellaceae bacterium]